MSQSVRQSPLKLLDGLAMTALTVMMLLTVADVVGRYVVSHPVPGAIELTEYAMVLLVFASLPSVTHRRSHVSVDLLSGALKGRWQRLALSISSAVSAVVLLVLAVVLWQHGQLNRELGDVIGYLRIPVYPAAFAMSALAAVTALVCSWMALMTPSSQLPSGQAH